MEDYWQSAQTISAASSRRPGACHRGDGIEYVARISAGDRRDVSAPALARQHQTCRAGTPRWVPRVRFDGRLGNGSESYVLERVSAPSQRRHQCTASRPGAPHSPGCLPLIGTSVLTYAPRWSRAARPAGHSVAC